MSRLEFRWAEEKDAALILRFIRELAAYEKLDGQGVATEELLREWIFEKGKAEVLFPVENGVEVVQHLRNPPICNSVCWSRATRWRPPSG